MIEEYNEIFDEAYMVYLCDIQHLTDDEAFEAFEKNEFQKEFVEYIKKGLEEWRMKND